MKYLSVFVAFAGLSACDGGGSSLERGLQPLEVRCAHPDLADDDWRCGEAREVECGHHDGAEVEAIYVHGPAAGDAACLPEDYALNDPGPYAPGEHTIIISRADEEICRSELTVVDTEPPEAETHTVILWPPNHKMHAVTPADCVTVRDACDGDVEVTFTWATSDEADEARGDGNTRGDIELGCDGASLRAERQGGADGRVYTLGWRAEDDAGHVIEGTCLVIVPHDRRGDEAVDSGERLREEAACGH